MSTQVPIWRRANDTIESVRKVVGPLAGLVTDIWKIVTVAAIIALAMTGAAVKWVPGVAAGACPIGGKVARVVGVEDNLAPLVPFFCEVPDPDERAVEATKSRRGELIVGIRGWLPYGKARVRLFDPDKNPVKLKKWARTLRLDSTGGFVSKKPLWRPRADDPSGEYTVVFMIRDTHRHRVYSTRKVLF
ncbi:hypothetical protein SAMN04489844_1215 [Nocardioides exalbidus]|uniref:Uncharacterized protein n=1 Tax=Nocardioides exalbidus TaxID=402596 RepID=A0A1H4MU95_9ACTN|nr:hypothetical protein [Nocardioides exalbidus]SEB86387.1 hypothetical protein SAMN04489844_1215 [Nocardioides exalbidus]